MPQVSELLEGNELRWLALTGKLAEFEGAKTPRNYSPCGVCLEAGGPILMERPERVYSWIADANMSIPEVLLVPLLINGVKQLGTLWIVAKEGQQFNSAHERVMKDLAIFTGRALQMVQSEQQLKKALEEQRAVAGEMSHRLKTSSLFLMA